MKINKTGKIFTSLFAASALFLVSGCEFLQGTLSSEMEKELESQTGVMSLDSKIWCYNGLSTEDMSLASEKLGDDYYNQSLLVKFSKQAAASNVSGSIELTYTNEDGNTVVEKFDSVTGTFTEDYKGYKIDMSEIMELFDTQKIPSGTAVMSLKLSGFKCAEGNQSGRAISALDVKNIQIKPLFSDYSVDFSTSGFSESSVIEFPLNSEIAIEGETETVTGTGSDGNTYSFEVTADGSSLKLKPADGFDFSDAETLKTNLENVNVEVNLRNLLPENNGDSYSNSITIRFTKYSVVIDGKKDANFTEEKGATVYTDDSGDSYAFSDSSTTTVCDFTEVAITNDEENLYVGISGNLNITWHNAVHLYFVKDGNTSAPELTETKYKAANSMQFLPSRSPLYPDAVLYHQPGYANSGSGVSGAAIASGTSFAALDSSEFSCGPAGWTSSESVDFVEYAIPLSKCGYSSGDKIYIVLASTLGWDDGANKAVNDTVGDALTYADDDHTSVKVNMKNGLVYTIK